MFGFALKCHYLLYVESVVRASVSRSSMVLKDALVTCGDVPMNILVLWLVISINAEQCWSQHRYFFESVLLDTVPAFLTIHFHVEPVVCKKRLDNVD